MTIQASRYDAGLRNEWDDFVRNSKNATFLLERGFMEYHADRFVDHSLVLRAESGQIVAVVPANEHAGDLHSHRGLTYGGLILGARTGTAAALDMLESVTTYMRRIGLSRLHYKTIPWIYHRQPAEEDRYALFRAGASLSRRDVLTVLPRENRPRYQERRSRGIKAARKAGVQMAESVQFAPFWSVLEDNLARRFQVRPVHSLDEIELLHSRFPDSIRLFQACLDDQVVAGCVVFETPQVAHVQYISASDEGKRIHALDGLFDHLLSNVYPDKPYLDFGISNEEEGKVLNVGLVEQKEGFGARAVVHDYYTLDA